jgi:KR domain.
MKVLILGGYGTFGGRLAQLLADESSATLIIAGRSYEKAAVSARISALPMRHRPRLIATAQSKRSWPNSLPI